MARRQFLRAAKALLFIICAWCPEAKAQHGGEGGYANLVERVRDQVVTLKVLDDGGQQVALGSGFIVSKGRVVTNRHVIERGSQVEVYDRQGHKLATERWAEAVDSVDDVAILPSIGAYAGLSFEEREPRVGDKVLVIGAPEGLSGSVSDGIVSAWRTLERDSIGDDNGRGSRVLQITAPISHGSSGGPVLSGRGRVLGMSVAVYGEGQNLNFAIPVKAIARVVGGAHGRVALPIQSLLAVEAQRGVWHFSGDENEGAESLNISVQDTMIDERAYLVSRTSYTYQGTSGAGAWQSSVALLEPKTLKAASVLVNMGTRQGRDTVQQLITSTRYVGREAQTLTMVARGYPAPDSVRNSEGAFDALSWYPLLLGVSRGDGTLHQDVKVFTAGSGVLEAVVIREQSKFSDGRPVVAVGLWRADGIRHTLLADTTGRVLAVRAYDHILVSDSLEHGNTR